MQGEERPNPIQIQPRNSSPEELVSLSPGSFTVSSFAESYRRTAGFQFERRNSSAHHLKHSLPLSEGEHFERARHRYTKSWNPTVADLNLSTNELTFGTEDAGEGSNKNEPDESFNSENNLLETEPLLRIQDDRVQEPNHPQSTFAQTVFNAVNILMYAFDDH